MPFLLLHWRPFAIGGLLLAAFAVGRFSAPKPSVKTEVREHVVTVTKEVKGEERVVAVTKNVVVYRDRIRKPDGTVTTHEEIHSGTDTHVDEKKTDVTAVVATKDVIQTVEVKTQVHTDWHVSALAGFGAGLTPVVGAAVDWRILGPFSVGAWGHVETAGKGLNPTGGVSLGMSF